MGIKVVNVGPDQVPVFIVGDPNTANQLASVLSVADATSLAGLFATVGQQVPLLLNAGGTYDRQKEAPGALGVPSVNTEGTKASYSTSTLAFTPAATATDFFTIAGSGTKTIRVTRISISGIATSGASNDIQLVKRTAANTGGTASNPTICQHDSNDAAATATVSLYSANPSGLGTGAGSPRGQKLNLGAAGAAGVIVWDFTMRNSKGIVLRSASQLLALNWNGASVPSGTSIDLDIEWTEE